MTVGTEWDTREEGPMKYLVWHRKSLDGQSTVDQRNLELGWTLLVRREELG